MANFGDTCKTYGHRQIGYSVEVGEGEADGFLAARTRRGPWTQPERARASVISPGGRFASRMEPTNSVLSEHLRNMLSQPVRDIAHRMWQPDADAAVCSITNCETAFTSGWTGSRRHHCRQCGRVVCNDCSRREVCRIRIPPLPASLAVYVHHVLSSVFGPFRLVPTGALSFILPAMSVGIVQGAPVESQWEVVVSTVRIFLV